MEQANWPIRVGGEYVSKLDGSILKRVTAIDGEQIHYTLVYKAGGPAFGTHDSAARYFRINAAPEDQSPLPAVEKFLEDLIAQGDDPQNLADGGHFLDTVQEAQKLLTRIKREA